MKILLMNTCGAEGIVALAEDGQVTAVELLPGRGTSEHLMPAIRRLFGNRGLGVQELGAVAVVNGPGSFTGVRVGLSAAKGLCEAGAVPMVALSRLGLVAGVEGESVALLDGGRGEFYTGLYKDGVRISEELLRADDARAMLAGRDAVTCEPKVAEALGVRLIPEPGPGAMLTLALARITASDWSDVALTDANYLRRTDAEILVHGR